MNMKTQQIYREIKLVINRVRSRMNEMKASNERVEEEMQKLEQQKLEQQKVKREFTG